MPIIGTPFQISTSFRLYGTFGTELFYHLSFSASQQFSVGVFCGGDLYYSSWKMAEKQEDYDVKSYTALVGLAEYFRTSQPPKIRECIHCLQASLNIGLPAILDAKVRLNISKLLLHQTNNVGHARSHLQQAVRTL